jgi:hypothetical protein
MYGGQGTNFRSCSNTHESSISKFLLEPKGEKFGERDSRIERIEVYQYNQRGSY